ncbi:death ligand signal enhancer [Sphaeramia orbicularis]|uniref:Death ligand signal enhancer n=1 Tax=Sphaeramia orbicularis TaxID=375764 RepID=A0A672YMR9_9TELE|nr:death ligand signal enhancer [Sphaeramia orbicularis]
MWRVQGLVGRVLHRCHSNTPLRLPQSHHVEDEVLNTSSVLSTSRHSSDCSSQKAEDGERRKKKRTFHFTNAGLPRYTVLDAMGWGAAAVLFMQICRIYSQFSSGSEPSPSAGALTVSPGLPKCGYRILLEILSRRDVLPRGQNVLCLHGIPKKQNQDQTHSQTISSTSTSEATGPSSSEQDHLPTDSTDSDHQRAPLNQDSPLLEECLLSSSCPLENNNNNNKTTDVNDGNVLSDEEKLEEAALNLKHVGDTSVPVILNIIGLESVKSKNYEEAFTCFLAAAQQGYSKAQFNTGVCYEKGRGVRKDKEKARHYYWQASVSGHTQAQYRYAKLLLTSREQQSEEELKTAINLLEKAAAAGLTKAQVCLASVYSQELVKDECKSVQYLKMAAERGDGTALLLLGQCFENGFGVQHNPQTAIEYYTQAAKAGNQQAKSLLKSTDTRGSTVEDTLLRSIRSSPCFSVADLRFQQPLSSLTSGVISSNTHPVTLPLMPHSWSTGSLCVPSTLPHHPHPQSAEGEACKWTVGIG